MRSVLRVTLVTVFAIGAVFATAVGAGAGAVLKVNAVTVVKVVDGPVAPGTTFTVGVDCTNVVSGSVGTTDVDHTDITFDSTGQPTSPDTVSVGTDFECTATETVNGGATSTAYACEMERGSEDEVGPPFQGNCIGNNEVTFGDVLGDTATITVSNTFATAPIQPVTPAAQAVQAAPAFTG